MSTEDGMIKLYDVRSYEKGPFTTFEVESRMGGQPNTFTSLQFSYDGRKLIATTPRQVLLLDAYDVRPPANRNVRVWHGASENGIP